MSETIIDEIPPTNGLITTESNLLVKEPGVNNEDEETWLYGKQKFEENADTTTAPSIDEVTTQEIDEAEKTTIPLATNQSSSILLASQLDDDSDDDDDGIQVTIGNIKAGASIFPPNRQNSRTMIPSGPVIPPKPQVTRGLDLDAQGMINGQPTYEHDLMNSYKDDEKPWKKPGADISDYFNYGFTEETWAQYCDRQRRLRAENNLARLNAAHIPQMPPMIPGHPPMLHPMNPHPAMMMNKPAINMPIMPRPFMNVRKQDGKIDVIGATDQTSRRQMFEAQNFEHPPYMNGPPFPGGQPPNGQTVGDLVTPPPTSNGPPSSHGTPPGSNHPIPTLGAHRLAMMPPPPGMQFRPQFGHPHAPGAPPFFPHGPGGGMHGERPPQPYFLPRHPQQQPWEKPGVPPVHGFPPGHFPPPSVPVPNNTGNGRPPSSRSPTPEDHSSRSSTPEENRPSGNNGDNDKSKDDRYKDRYRDDREHYSSSRRRSSPRDRGSSAYRSRHRSGDHEYERPRGDRKSSRDRDDKYERYSRKRHHREEGSRHHRGDDESSRSHRSTRRSPAKNFSSPPKTLVPTINSQFSSTESPQILSENVESTENDQSPQTITSTTNPIIPSSTSPTSRSRRDESERSSSRHGHHKKSSKRSRRDSDDERGHHRRSKDKSSGSKKSSNQSEISSDIKEQLNE